VAVLGAEPRVPDPAPPPLARQGVEPVPPGTPGVLARLHQHDRGDLAQPRPLRGPLGEGDHTALHFGVAEPLPCRVGVLPSAQGVVVDHPSTPERSRECLVLRRRQVQAVAVPDEHATESTWPMRQEDDYRRGRHVVSALDVHVVFVTKYRRGVLTDEHPDTLREVSATVCADFSATLVEMDGDNQVHLLVAYPPQVAVARLVNALRASPPASCAPARGPHPPRAPMVSVVFRRLGGWRPAGNAKAVHPPAARPRPTGLIRPERRGLRPEDHGDRS
jgi:hypothetical protein